MANAKRRRAVRMTKSYKYNDVVMRERAKLEREVMKLAGKVNARINTLERKNLIKDSFATKTLKKNLGTRGSRIRIKRGQTLSNLRLTQKYLKSFLKSKTTTKKGLEERKREVKATLKEAFFTDDDRMLDDFFNLTQDSDYLDYFSDKLNPSEAYSLIREATEEKRNPKEFAERILAHMNETNDAELKDASYRLYYKYIDKYMPEEELEIAEKLEIAENLDIDEAIEIVENFL